MTSPLSIDFENYNSQDIAHYFSTIWSRKIAVFLWRSAKILKASIVNVIRFDVDLLLRAHSHLHFDLSTGFREREECEDRGLEESS